MQNTISEYDVLSEVESMTLSKVLDRVTVTKIFQTMFGRMVVTHEVEVRRVQYDSRKVERGDLFVAIRGTAVDGTKFIEVAVNNGAKVIVTENDSALSDSYFMHTGVVKVVVPDSRIALAQIAANYFQHPSRDLTMVGVTGTNGKTTTTHLIASFLEASGNRAGLVGTIDYRIGDEVIPATHTTPESLELNSLLARMVEQKCSSAVMEVSSHALHQHRVYGLDFDAAVFTNLTQDHLDYHGTMDKYFNAKMMLFDNLRADGCAIINTDDPWGQKLSGLVGSKKYSYGISSGANVLAKNVSLSINRTKFAIEYQGKECAIDSSLVGRFNVYNILAAFTTGLALDVPVAAMQNAVRTLKPIKGRFEQIASPNGWTAVIDYAHTPDALEKALMAVHDILGAGRRSKIITVFGCGGNRDALKRPIMGRIATEQSDSTIVTSDNPRHEDPESIIDQIIKGVKPGATVYHEADRAKAIALALGMAQPGDVVLIAGKGHEEYQVIGDRRIHFSDREVVEEFLRGGA